MFTAAVFRFSAVPNRPVIVLSLGHRARQARNYRQAYCHDRQPGTHCRDEPEAQFPHGEQSDDGRDDSAEPYRTLLGEQQPGRAQKEDDSRDAQRHGLRPCEQSHHGAYQAGVQPRPVRDRLQKRTLSAIGGRADGGVGDVRRPDESVEAEGLHQCGEPQVPAKPYERGEQYSPVTLRIEDDRRNEKQREREQTETFEKLELLGSDRQESRPRGPSPPSRPG